MKGISTAGKHIGIIKTKKNDDIFYIIDQMCCNGDFTKKLLIFKLLMKRISHFQKS